MANTRNRRREGSAITRMATKVTGVFRRPKNTLDVEPIAEPKRRTGKRIKRTTTGILKTKVNRRRENPILVMLLWLLPMSAALAAFATPFLGARAYEYLMSTGHFMVRDVMVGGAEHLEQPEVLSLAGIRAGTHVLSSDLDAMARRIESHPWVANARVERELPDRLIVTIDEHRPVAQIVLERMWLVNASGEPFSEATRGESLDLPIITGIEGKAFAEGTSASEAAVARADVRAAVNLTRLYAEVGLDNRWPVAEIRVERGGHMTLVVSQLGTEAVLGLGPYRQKLYRLEWVLEKLHQDSKTADYVLLDGVAARSGMRDDGKVVVASDLARSAAEIASEAERRAKIARELEASNYQPSLEELGNDHTPRPISQGVRPAVGPVFLDEGEEAEGATLDPSREEE